MKYLMLSPFVFLFCLGSMLAMKLVPPNSHVGFRSGRTFGDEATWYHINSVVGWSLISTTLVCGLVVWKVFSTSLSLTAKSLVSTGLLVALSIVTVLVGTLV